MDLDEIYNSIQNFRSIGVKNVYSQIMANYETVITNMFDINDFKTYIFPLLENPTNKSLDTIKEEIYNHVNFQKQKAARSIVSQPFNILRSIKSYHVKDYDYLLENLKATPYFPFIKFTRRSGEIFYKVYKDFIVPEEWFTQDEDIDFIIKIKKTDKIRKDIDDAFLQAYIKRVSDDDDKNIIIIEHDNDPKLKKYYEELANYIEHTPVKIMLTGESIILNSGFTPSTKLYFTDFIFFHSKHFEFDESKNTVGAKKDRYYLKVKKTDIRLSFTKIFSNAFTLNIVKVEENKANQIIGFLIDELYKWHSLFDRIKKDYDSFFNKFAEVHSINETIETPKQVSEINLDKSLSRNKAMLANVKMLADREYNVNIPKHDQEFIPNYARNCQSKFQPYVLDSQSKQILDTYLSQIPEQEREKFQRNVTVHTKDRTKQVSFDIACAPRDDAQPTIFPYGKEHDGHTYPCCSKSYIPSDKKNKEIIANVNSRVQQTQNKVLSFGKSGEIDSWWEKYCKIIETPNENYSFNSHTGTPTFYHIRYSLGDTPDSFLRNVLYSKGSADVPIANSLALANYMIEKEFPTEVTYETHVAELSATYKLNICVFNEDGTFIINDSTPEFNMILPTILMIKRNTLYELIIHRSTRSSLFMLSSNSNLYSFISKIYKSYKTFQIVRNRYI